MATRKDAKKRKRPSAKETLAQTIGAVIVPMALKQAMLVLERELDGRVARAVEDRLGETTQRDIIIPRYKAMVDRRVLDALKSLQFRLVPADVPFEAPNDDDDDDEGDRPRGGLYRPDGR